MTGKFTVKLNKSEDFNKNDTQVTPVMEAAFTLLKNIFLHLYGGKKKIHRPGYTQP